MYIATADFKLLFISMILLIQDSAERNAPYINYISRMLRNENI